MTGFTCIDEVVRFVIGQLDDLDGTIYHSKSSSSVYIRFDEPGLGSLTIRDHLRCARHFKWNLVMGYRGKKRIQRGCAPIQYFYSEHTVLDLVSDIRAELDSLRCGRHTCHKRTNAWA